MTALVAVGCGGGKFISVDQGNATRGGTNGVVASGGAAANNTIVSDGGANIGGGATTGGSRSETGDGSGGTAATGGSHPTQAGANSTGGLPASGGSLSSGGNIATTGGSFSSGGNLNSGGKPQSIGGSKNTTGGVSLNTGGMRASGGSSPTGGTVGTTGGTRPVTGGNVSTGGTFVGSGGNSSKGGNPGTGGLTASGGQSSVTLTFGERPDANCTGLTIDTVLNSGNPDLNYGLAPLFGCDASPPSVGLLEFHLYLCTGQIGTLSKVLAARLHLHTGDCTGCQSSPNTTVQIFELLEYWDEGSGPDTGEIGTANWNERISGTAWLGPGATGASRGALLNSFKPAAVNTEYIVELPAAAVQGWLDNSLTNFGVVLSITSTAVTPTDAVSFVASDGEKTLSPLLEIDFVSN